MEILTYKEVQHIRDTQPKSKYIMPQLGFQERVLRQNADIQIVGGERGGGKALTMNELVLTPNGFVKMGSLKVGDIVSDTDGGEQIVTEVHDVGTKPVYKLKFIDGAECECSEDHLWNVRVTNKKKRKDAVTTYFGGELMTTKEIVSFIDNKRTSNVPTEGHRNLLTPLCSPIHFNDKYRSDRVLDPYILGLLLGDGCITGSVDCAGFTTSDKEIIESIRFLGFDVRKHTGNDYSYSIRDSSLVDNLKQLKLWGTYSYNKFIPEPYKYSSVSERISLIQGLLDTDGTVDNRGHVSYCTTSKQLADDIQWIIRSLGGKATVTLSKSGYKGKDGKYIKCRDSYDVYINTSMNKKLFRLQRHIDRCKDGFNGGVSTLARRIVDYEYIGEKECRCIAVSHKNHLFITRDFIVTHNTYVLLMGVLQNMKNPHFESVIIRREKDDFKRGGGLWDTSTKIFTPLGEPTESSFLWRFYTGSKLKFEHMANEDKADQRFRGQQIAYIGIDEVDQIKEETFWFLMSSNRNAHGIKNKIVGTCNPNAESWVKKLIQWYIGDDGFPISEREGVVRYFFKYGESIDEVFWGDTKEEVYQKAKGHIDKLYRKELEGLVSKYDMIKSLVFIRGRVDENKILLESDPNYIGSIAQGGEASVAKELEGNWNSFDSGDGLIKTSQMRALFNNIPQTDGQRWLTIDVAMEGGDKFIIWVWDGWHLVDVFIYKNISAPEIIREVQEVAKRYRIPNNRIIYDALGMGAFMGSKYQNKGFIPNSIGYKSNGTPKDRSTFTDLNAEITNEFVIGVIDGKISFDPSVLKKTFEGKTIAEQLLLEVRAMRWQKDNGITRGKLKLIPKKEMRQIIGCSPDGIDSLKMRFYANYKGVFSNIIRYIY